MYSLNAGIYYNVALQKLVLAISKDLEKKLYPALIKSNKQRNGLTQDRDWLVSVYDILDDLKESWKKKKSISQ